MTPDEKALFGELDAASTALDSDELEAKYEVIVPLGTKHGLRRNEAIAFWIRCTFRIFEPPEFAPGVLPDEPPIDFNDLMFQALDYGFASIKDGGKNKVPDKKCHHLRR